MLHRLTIFLVFLLFLDFSLDAQTDSSIGKTRSENTYVWSDLRHGLRPRLQVYRTDANNWMLSLAFVPLTNFPRDSWLMPANYFGSKLLLWTTNGNEVKPTDKRVREANNLPVFTTVSNALHVVNPTRRSGQWLYGKMGQPIQTANFDLRTAFSIPFTDDVYLQMTPLMYKENTNAQTVWLEEFRSIRIKLKANGGVEEFGNDPL